MRDGASGRRFGSVRGLLRCIAGAPGAFLVAGAAAAASVVALLVAARVAAQGSRCVPSVVLDVPASVKLGDRVPLTLKARNTTPAPCSLYLGGRPPHDFVVRRGGSLVWNWRHGRPVQLVLEVRRLGPKEEAVFEGEWDQVDNSGRRVPPGTYLVRGVLHLEPPQVLRTPPRRLVIVPP